jgi:hypothetical protein
MQFLIYASITCARRFRRLTKREEKAMVQRETTYFKRSLFVLKKGLVLKDYWVFCDVKE